MINQPSGTSLQTGLARKKTANDQNLSKSPSQQAIFQNDKLNAQLQINQQSQKILHDVGGQHGLNSDLAVCERL
jgi:hypothetical protein